jgi:hypothetical protein
MVNYMVWLPKRGILGESPKTPFIVRAYMIKEVAADMYMLVFIEFAHSLF